MRHGKNKEKENADHGGDGAVLQEMSTSMASHLSLMWLINSSKDRVRPALMIKGDERSENLSSEDGVS